jgi:hypothetical protein
MTREQQGAMGQAGALADQMRGSAQTEAFGNAALQAQQRELNDAATAAAMGRQTRVAGAGMQGEMAHQAARRQALATAYGQQQQANQIAQQRNDQQFRTIYGAAQGAAMQAGNLYNWTQNQGGEDAGKPKKDPLFAWSG